MGRRIQKVKGFLKSAFEYFIKRCRSDDYYDHELVERIKYRRYLNKQAKNPVDAVRLQQMPIGDRMRGKKGATRSPEEVLSYENNAMFLRFRKGKCIAIYVLKKKSDTLGYLVSTEMGPIEVKIL